MIQPGLERIGRLLKGVDFPWKAVHVAGTNGKGSVCYMASHLLTRRSIKCGRFTSPHLINRWDVICINEEVVEEGLFRKVEAHYMELNERENISASPFEILTATAFTIFNEKQVQVGVVEVGMGGRLDATNILNNQVVSVINKIARDHQDFLGNSLEEIAHHKAGILRPNVPYLLNPFNDLVVQQTINQYAKEIGAGPRIVIDTLQRREEIFSRKLWHSFAQPLVSFQRDNAILGLIAAQEAVQGLGLQFENPKVLKKLKWVANRNHYGRQDFTRVEPLFGVPGRPILVDGAHNPDAAKVLRKLVNRRDGRRARRGDEVPSAEDELPITWVVAMKDDKNALGFFRTLLRPGDSVVTTSFGPVDGMPWVKPMDPEKLLQIAKSAHDGITGLHIPKEGVLRAIYAGSLFSGPLASIVLTGSLYLVGDFYRQMQKKRGSLWTDDERVKEREKYRIIQEEEQERYRQTFGGLKTLSTEGALANANNIRQLETLGSSTSSNTNSGFLKAYQSLSVRIRSVLTGTDVPSNDSLPMMNSGTADNQPLEIDSVKADQIAQQSNKTSKTLQDDLLVSRDGMRDSDRIDPLPPEENMSKYPFRVRKHFVAKVER